MNTWRDTNGYIGFVRLICGVLLLIFASGPNVLATDRRGDSERLLTLIDSSMKALREGCRHVAWEILVRAEKLSTPGSREEVDLRIAFALVHLWTGDFAKAEGHLNAALALARQFPDRYGEARLLNNFGNLRATQDEILEAYTHYESAIGVADENRDWQTLAEASANAAQIDARSKRWNRVQARLDDLVRAIQVVEDLNGTEMLWLKAAELDLELAVADVERESRLKEAGAALESARKLAERRGDDRIRSLVAGLQGRAAEMQARYQEAIGCLMRAVKLAVRANAADLVVDWEWRLGRLWLGLGRIDLGKEAYRRAIGAHQSIRGDLARGFGNSWGSLREGMGGLYFEMADLQLREATTQEDLRAARDVIELWRSAELEEYFRDECISQRLKESVSTEMIEPGAAVIYVIPLAERLEILVCRSGKLERFVVRITETELMGLADELRFFLEKRTTFQFRRAAQRLYAMLVAPLIESLEAGGTRTLVWVPVGKLRAVPMAALHDGNRYLVEKFGMAIAPALHLINPEPLPRRRATILLAGLTGRDGSRDGLEHVPAELDELRRVYRAKMLLDDDFRLEEVRRQLQRANFSIVHVASHARFDHRLQNSSIEAHDGTIDLNELEQLIRPSQYRGTPIGLLVLSACETAVGDDRAALGLAGLAVKCGARSALASLWTVNDEATAFLVSNLYRELHDAAGKSKAQALRGAQRALIGSEAFRHPFYWSAFVLIGNWL